MMLVRYVLALDRSRGGGIMMQHQQHACTHDARSHGGRAQSRSGARTAIHVRGPYPN